MSNADDRCAFLLQSGAPCGVWRDTHPMIPFKPEFHHPFVEPAPRPAPSGDEEKVREIAEKHMAGYGSVPVNYVERAAREAYAAGKADGAREASAGCYCKTRQFRVMDAPTGCPQLVPWWLLAPFEPQARENHEQSLERLDARGGLAPSEILAVIEGRRFRRMDDAEAGRQLAIVVADAIARRGKEGA